MIYNDEFVWIHFPKCAGSKIEILFKKYLSKNNKNLHQDPFSILNDPSISWHDSISKREKKDPTFSLNGRTAIYSFRRLPSWLESRYLYEYERSPSLPHNPELLLQGKFLEAYGSVNWADSYAKQFIPKNILESGHIRFIRTEYFETDFKAIFGDYLDISKIPNKQFKKRINSTKMSLPNSIKEQLYADTPSIYDHCPYWKSIEDIAY